MPVPWEARDNLLHLVLQSEYTFEEIASALESGLATVHAEPLRILWDGSEATTVPDVQATRRGIELLRKHRGRCAKIAIVGRAGVSFGLARQIAQTLDCADTAVRAFGDVKEAKQWLRQRPSGVTSRV